MPTPQFGDAGREVPGLSAVGRAMVFWGSQKVSGE